MPVTNLKIVTDADLRIKQLADTMYEINIAGECTKALLLAEGFSEYEIVAYAGPARVLANKRFVRQVDTEDDEPSDEQVIAIALDRCTGVLSTPQIIALLRDAGVPNRVIARLWDQITVKVAATIAKLAKPSPAELRKAFA